MNNVLSLFIVLLFFACNSAADSKKTSTDHKEIIVEDKVPKPSTQEDFRPKENIQMNDYNYITSVRKNNLWYFINERNEVLFDKEFTYATFFSDDLVCVAMDGMRWPGEDAVYGAYYTAMDKQGKLYENIQSDLPFVFKEGRAIISYGPLKRLINKRGDVLKETTLAAYGEYNEGKVAVFKEGKIEFWDKEGNVVIGPSVFTTQSFSENRALVLLNGKFGFIDKAGELVVPYIYEGGRNYKNGFASVKKEDGYYFIDKGGVEVLGPYLETRDFQEEKAGVFLNGEWKYIDDKGNIVFDTSYLEADSFSEGIAIVRKESNELALLTENGDVINLDARVAMQFNNGIAIAEKDGKMGYITNEGKWMIEPQYEMVHDFTLID